MDTGFEGDLRNRVAARRIEDADGARQAVGDPDPAVPPDTLVRLGKALGDPLRLRALREPRDGPLTLTDLAERFVLG
ncbi:MAG: hypothetical protein WEE50_03770 [Chloroflexota bacterium]